MLDSFDLARTATAPLSGDHRRRRTLTAWRRRPTITETMIHLASLIHGSSPHPKLSTFRASPPAPAARTATAPLSGEHRRRRRRTLTAWRRRPTITETMFRLSNNLIGILNFLTFLLSVPILGAGIWLSTRASSDCERFLDKPVIALGVFLMVVSLAGLVGACCRVTWLLWVYLVVMFLLILLVLCFTVFAFVVTNKGAGEAVSGRGYKEYRLGDYSNWLQKRVNNGKNWRRIRSCLQDSKVCKSMQEGSQTFDQFFRDHLSPIQSGCCKPPSECGFTYTSPTMWNGPANSSNPDCASWRNDPSTLCYNCQSCKAGVLANIKNDWKKVAVVNIVVLVFLIIVYSVGCCAFRNNREDNSYPRWKGYP